MGPGRAEPGGGLPVAGRGERRGGRVIVIEALSLLSGALGLLQGGGVSVLPGIAFALAVLRGFSSTEARNWFDR
ncbi:hypothetical protein [Streptomyces sp. NBC_00582]|uniref:hypothetical protein n=1 Tax=Streptomyces sp. NBC_00582 TaxID=2975783 RepID=UPI002E7FEE63|nr:hypothetical protein [Streptomyces sp. NBC_00582]WUB59476.1 hypothetical protein OG852_03215 [Streptomyces sp. NBC_00582]